MAVFLVCEGENRGLDNRILDPLVIQHHNLTVQLAPSGGSGGLGGVRVCLRNLAHNNIAMSVEDRDYFRTQAQADAGWGNPAASEFFWRRHEIENYLLHPSVVLALFNDLRATSFGWVAALPTTEAGVLTLLQTVATPFTRKSRSGSATRRTHASLSRRRQSSIRRD
jgi:hypothetical protein